MKVGLKVSPKLDAGAATAAMNPARVLPALARAFGKAANEVLGRAVKNRFSGKGPFPPAQNKLGVRTNRLRKSLRAAAPKVSDDARRITIDMGSNVSYFQTHEMGFKGSVQVRGHTRRTVAAKEVRGRLTKLSVKRQRGRLKAGRAAYQLVRPHKRKVNVTARAPLGTELRAVTTRAAFYSALKAVVARILKSKP